MINPPRNASGMPTNLPVVAPHERPRRAAEHDEWLLDEALAETFPASDPIAVSSIYLPRVGPSRSPEIGAGSGRISGRGIGRVRNPEATVLDATIECDRCHARIPADTALGFEGADYLYHFCGPQCFEAWSKSALAHGR